MSVTITRYDGDGEALSALIQRSWQAALDGRVWYPVWGPDFINWRVMDPRVLDRDLVTVAWQSDQLVACMVSIPQVFSYRGGTVPGTLTSYLSVLPDVQAPHVATRMLMANRKANIEKGMQVSLGVHHAHKGAAAAQFWNAWGKRRPDEFKRLGPIRSWVKIIDGRAVSAASLKPKDAMAAAVGGRIPFGWIGRRGQGVAPDPGDIDRDLRTVNAPMALPGLQALYTQATLAHALHHPFCRAVRHPSADALAAGYLIDWKGRRDVRVGFFDLIAGSASAGEMADTLVALGRKMQQEQACMLVCMDQGALPAAALWRAGFAPVPAEVDYFAWYKDKDLELPAGLRVRVPFI